MTLVFLHIDKTGGMSVRELLARHYAADEIRPVTHHAKATWQTDAYPTVQQDLFVAHTQFQHDSAHKLVMGHWDWSIINRMKLEQPKIITVLRDPVERAASLWRFVCKEQGMFGDVSRRATDMGFGRWARLYSGAYANQMTAQLAGCRWAMGGAAKVDEAAFVLAVNHLRQCAVVGLTEKMMSFTREVRQLMHWTWSGSTRGRAIITRVNETPKLEEIDEDTADYIRRVSYLDVELYELVRWKYGEKD